MFFALSFLSVSRQHHSEGHRHHYHHRDEVPNVSGSQIYDKAVTKVGCTYVKGASGPNTFDCSGLVMWAHKQCGISTPRVSKDQARGGKKGSYARGDVVAFGNPVHHVGICDGNGNFIHAPQTGDVVKITALSARRDIAACRRYW